MVDEWITPQKKKRPDKEWYIPTGSDLSDFVITAGVSLGIEFLPYMESFNLAQRAAMVGSIGALYGIGVSRGLGIKTGARSGVAALEGAAFGATLGYILKQYMDVI